MKIGYKHIRIVFLLFIVCSFAGFLFVLYQQYTKNLKKGHQDIPRYENFSKHLLEIQGFRYDANYESKKTISIRADKFTIENVKMGYFKLGPIKVARLKNAAIDIYGKRTQDGEQVLPKAPSKRDNKSTGYVKPQQRITFQDIFSKEALPSLLKWRIYSLVMEPVSVKLYDERSLVTQIHAAYGKIRIKRQDILFSGNVRVISGPRILKTNRLSMKPENGAIETDRSFVLNTPKKRFKGRQMITDIFLSYDPNSPNLPRRPVRKTSVKTPRRVGPYQKVSGNLP